MIEQKLTSVEIRRWVHRFVGLAVLVLLLTGVLVTFPDVRTVLIGGRGQLLSDIHMWTSVILIGAPIVALVMNGKEIFQNLKKRMFNAKTHTWRRYHLSLTVVAGVAMSLIGCVLLIDSKMIELPIVMMDVFFWLHLAGAWLLGSVLLIHLWMAHRGIARTLKQWCGLDKKEKARKARMKNRTSSRSSQDVAL